MKKYIYLFVLLVVMYIITSDWTKLVLFPFFGLCLYMGAKEKYWYNPFNILLLTLTSYALYYYKIAPFLIDDLPLTTNIFILLCLSGVILGYIIARNIKIRPMNIVAGNENFWIVFVVGLLPTALSYVLYGNILDATEDLADFKERSIIPMLNQLGYFLPASIIVACKNNNSKQILIAVVFSALASLMTISKTGMLMVMIFLIIGLNYYKPKVLELSIFKLLRKFAIIWIPLLIIYLFAYNNNMRNNADSKSSTEWISKGGSKIIKSGDNMEENLYLNYLYLCSPWSNLNYNIERNHIVGYGSNTFAQFGKKIGVNVQKVEKIQPSFLNTHTFITDYYLDFGYLGAIIASILLGFIIYCFYIKLCSSHDALLISYYALICFATGMLFFSNHFNNGYLLNYLITMGGYYFISRMNRISKNG